MSECPWCDDVESDLSCPVHGGVREHEPDWGGGLIVDWHRLWLGFRWPLGGLVVGVVLGLVVRLFP